MEAEWLRKPNGDDLADVYPAGALMVGSEGFAALRCRVPTRGPPVDCEILQEAPAGLGFGDAAIAASRQFVFAPQLRDGHPTDQGIVTIPLKFTVPGGQSHPGGAPAYLLRQAGPDQSLPTTRTWPCPEETGKLCIMEPLAWAVAPEPFAFIGLYGVVGFLCRINGEGGLEACVAAAVTPDAHVNAAAFYTSRYRAPLQIGGRPTVGRWVIFYIVPPARP